MRTILTDIEGTTSSIAFVRDVLFPYARRELPRFVAERGNQAEVRRWLDAIAAEARVVGDQQIVGVLQRWIDEDRKHTALKALQGMLWQAGYAQGDYRAHVYTDAAQALRRWQSSGHALYVYSSGSVAAQKLFFRHTEFGDLTALFSGHFDTEIGAKRESASYHRIAEAIGAPPAQMVFLSDVIEELDAAQGAGMRTVLIDRPQDYPHSRTGTSGTHRRAVDFATIDPDRV